MSEDFSTKLGFGEGEIVRMGLGTQTPHKKAEEHRLREGGVARGRMIDTAHSRKFRGPERRDDRFAALPAIPAGAWCATKGELAGGSRTSEVPRAGNEESLRRPCAPRASLSTTCHRVDRETPMEESLAAIKGVPPASSEDPHVGVSEVSIFDQIEEPASRADRAVQNQYQRSERNTNR